MACCSVGWLWCLKGACENQPHGSNLGRCQLAVASLCRLYPVFALFLRKNSMGRSLHFYSHCGKAKIKDPLGQYLWPSTKFNIYYYFLYFNVNHSRPPFFFCYGLSRTLKNMQKYIITFCLRIYNCVFFEYLNTGKNQKIPSFFKHWYNPYLNVHIMNMLHGEYCAFTPEILIYTIDPWVTWVLTVWVTVFSLISDFLNDIFIFSVLYCKYVT